MATPVVKPPDAAMKVAPPAIRPPALTSPKKGAPGTPPGFQPFEGQEKVPATSNLPAPRWPVMVPALDAAIGMLRGEQEVPPELQTITQGFVKALISSDRQALMADDSEDNRELLRRALGVRWRVAAAIALKPETSADIDTAAVDALFAEVDTCITDVSNAISNTPAELQAPLTSSRGELARDAVSLSEAVHAVPAPEGQEPAKYERKPQARLMKVYANDSAQGPTSFWKEKRPHIVFGIALLLAAGYHGYHFFDKPPPRQASNLSMNLPSGAAAATSATNGATVIVTPGAQAATPQEIQRLRDSVAAQGKTLLESSPGMFVVFDSPPSEGGQPKGSTP